MFVNEYNHLEHLYYGPTIEPFNDLNDARIKYEFELGTHVSYSKASKGYMLNNTLLEVSTFGKGDYREPTIHLELPSGSRTIDLLYKGHETVQNLVFKNMPQATKNDTLKVILEDSQNKVTVNLYYTVYETENVIVRNLEIINHNEQGIILDKALSCSLDMLNKDFTLTKLDGTWIRERNITNHKLTFGTVHFDSKKGVSSNDHNPFFALKESNTLENYGKCYGFALVYSGSFEANVELSPHNLLRANIGVNSFDFRYPLKKDESFITPEVVLTCSNTGLTTLSNQFHEFISSNIVNQNFKNKVRPILVNNWEATYFDFNQKKLLAIAKKAKKLGIELFCLDDGWFGKRNDDYSSLGDWYYNKKKLPRGVKGLADRVNKIGLDFGIWVEPEMVNEDSDLYREHPEWVVKIPNQEPSLGRNQLVLDLTNKYVLDYLKKTLFDLFDSANISYVKWDMNRNFSDVFSSNLDIKDQGKFYYLYTLGLYEVLEYLTSTFPHILFESCASGGNRFDLGMLYYMPQTWTSDNTDSYERLKIQEGTSLCYPLSSISNHVCGDSSHQVLRNTPLETRFNVACFGVLGYELDLSQLTSFDEKVIQKQIEFYKEHRHLFQFGRFTRLRSVYSSNQTIWMVMNETNDQAIIGVFQKLATPSPCMESIQLEMFDEGTYSIKNRTQYHNIRTFGTLVNEALPIKLKVNHFLHNTVANRYLFEADRFDKVLTNNQLKNSGLLLHHTFTGTGLNEKVMVLEDFGSRLFVIRKNEHTESQK
jgi:alpha-galactosidase